MIRLLVVDDHAAVRTGLVDYLDAHEEFAVVGEASNGRDAVDACARERPDVVVMDIRMPVLDGIEATRLIKGVDAGVRVVLVTAYEQDELVESGRNAGADAIVYKGAAGADLVKQIRGAAA